MDSVTLAGTAILSALVVVFDYALKFSGLKIPFPWLPFLKFDLTGIPIMLSLLLYGLPSGIITSVTAFIAIFARSSNIVGSSMKFVAELSTALGAAVGLRLSRSRFRMKFLFFGVALRCVVMAVVCSIVLPLAYLIPSIIVIGWMPLLIVFNAVQGGISIVGGLLLYELLLRRFPQIRSL